MTPLLRPLSFSEMADRAFFLAVRTLLPMAAVVPLTAAIAFGGAWVIVYVAVVYAHVPTLIPAILGCFFLFAVVVAGHGAALTGEVDAYFGRPVRFSRMLTGARHTWPQLMLAFLIYFVMFGLLAGVAIALYFAAIWFASEFPFLRSSPGNIISIGIVILTFCLLLALYALIQCVGYIAFVGCVAEWSPALESWERSWARSMTGGRGWRTLGYGVLIAFAGFALAFALQLIGLGITALLPRGSALVGIVSAAPVILASFFTFVFEVAWFVVYYVDLRVRTEGLDLTLQSDSLQPVVAVAQPEA
jgi:hypothetical protein